MSLSKLLLLYALSIRRFFNKLKTINLFVLKKKLIIENEFYVSSLDIY